MTVPPAPSEPRVAHYLYAHRAVPRAFLRNPPAILGILGSKDAMEFLSGMWRVLDRELEPQHRLPATGLSVSCFELADDIFAAVVTMPPPQRVFEAFFVGCCARLEGEAPFARAFTLDLAGPPVPHPQTGLLEWNAEGEHELLETPGTEPDLTAFTDAIERVLAAGGVTR